MKKRLLSLFLATLISISVFLPCSLPAVAAQGLERDTVLVLDISGSMSGKPMQTLISSAQKFCESVLSQADFNRVAIVAYATTATLLCDFTQDLYLLETSIAHMSDYGVTNIYDALDLAGELLEYSTADVKNIVLMSDGLPNEGTQLDYGRYFYSDYDGYRYANAVYEQAVAYHSDYYIYTLGFF